MPLAASAAYVALVVVGPRLMADRKPVQLREFMLCMNLYQVAVNAVVVVLAVREVWAHAYPVWAVPLDPSPTQHGLRMAMFLHYTDKFSELLDSAVMVLRRKESQLSFLHCYHHLLMPWVWWLVLRRAAGEA